jgi:hypothetical protein
MNAIDLLEQQHEKTLDGLEQMCEAEEIDPSELRLLADELVAHMVIEEHVFYPRMKELAEDIVVESFEEHAVARFALARLMMAKGEEEQKARVKVLKELVKHHVDEERSELFPKVRKRIAGDELERLGDRMEMMFEKAVEAGLETLVVGTDQSLRSAMNGGASKKNGAKRPSGRPRAMHAR